MKRLIYIMAAVFIAAIHFDSSAVTDKEMEQARVIAAQTYLRWANDGSGYLDAIHPTTMAALEKNLKPKEKENLKAFKSIAVPKDYPSWDKKKLVEYWSATAFASPKLSDSGRRGKDRVRKKLNAMTVSAPARQASPTPSQTPAQTNASQTPAQTDASSATSTSSANATGTAAATSGTTPPSAEAPDSLKASLNEAEAIASSAIDIEEEIEIRKAENHTWIYIVILCILVAVVIALVVFASNVMKRNSAVKGDETDSAKTPSPEPIAPSPLAAPTTQKETNEEINRMREKFAATLTAKNGEIHILNKKLEESLRQNTALKNNLEALTTEVNTLRNRLATMPQIAQPVQTVQAIPTNPAPIAPENHQPRATAQEQAATQVSSAAPVSVPLRSIYLGRANAKGIFVRADRTLNLGNSIYRLDTTDGYAGSFRVANDPTVWQMALLTPRESLGGACVAADLDATEGMQRIVNDASGTAIFEGGCWKVIRKAKIHYE